MESKLFSSVKSMITNTFYLFKVHLKYFPSPQYIYDYLKVQPVEVQRYELRNISDMISVNKNNDFYNTLLKLFIPGWDLNIKEAKFITGGWGTPSLNSYRKVKIGDNLWFEKVYFTSSRELNALQWLQKNIYPLLKKDEEISVPEIIKIYKSEVLSIVYFDFMQLSSLDNKKSIQPLIILTKRLYKASLREDILELMHTAPDYLKDYRSHFQYKQNIEYARTQLSEYHINTGGLEVILEKNRNVLTHGDMQHTNVFKNFKLIDWDLFGIFPAGFDPAFLFFRFFEKGNIKFNIVDWLEKNYKDTVPQNQWSLFQLSFSYFLFIFYCDLFNQKTYQNIKHQLIEQLKYDK